MIEETLCSKTTLMICRTTIKTLISTTGRSQNKTPQWTLKTRKWNRVCPLFLPLNRTKISLICSRQTLLINSPLRKTRTFTAMIEAKEVPTRMRSNILSSMRASACSHSESRTAAL